MNSLEIQCPICNKNFHQGYCFHSMGKYRVYYYYYDKTYVWSDDPFEDMILFVDKVIWLDEARIETMILLK